MIRVSKKLIMAIFSTLFLMLSIQGSVFASLYNWVGDPSVDKWMVYDGDTKITDKIIFDDLDSDGIAYYYYVDKDGYVLVDTICPDYYIVDSSGRRLDKYGDAQTVDVTKMDIKSESGKVEESGIIAELYAQAINEQDGTGTSNNSISQGAINNVNSKEVFGPNLYVENVDISGEAKSILGKGVVLKEKEKEEEVFDPLVDSEMKNYIKSGSDYSKSVNGTTFTKSKWKAVMALRGNGASVEFENPNNNFNKVSGRIATHYFTYTERETICTLIVTDANGEEVYSTSDFNYNSGKAFSFTFPKKSKTLRFELQVDGQYSTRVAYVRDLKYGFSRIAWQEEKEQDLEDAEIEGAYRTAANELIVEEVEVDDDTEVDEDGYTKSERAALASKSNADNNEDDEEEDDGMYDTSDEEDNDDLDSIKTEEGDDKFGPSFDKKLQEEAQKKANYGPGFVGITLP